MTLTEDEYKALLRFKIDNNATGVKVVDLSWKHNSDRPSMELQYQYTLIEVIEVILGGSWRLFDVQTPAREDLKLSQPFKNMVEIAKRADAEILRIQGEASLVTKVDNMSPVVGPCQLERLTGHRNVWKEQW